MSNHVASNDGRRDSRQADIINEEAVCGEEEKLGGRASNMLEKAERREEAERTRKHYVEMAL